MRGILGASEFHEVPRGRPLDLAESRCSVRCGFAMSPVSRRDADTGDPMDGTPTRCAATEYVYPWTASTQKFVRRRPIGIGASHARGPPAVDEVDASRQALRLRADGPEIAMSICATVHDGSRISRHDRTRNLPRAQLFCNPSGRQGEPVDSLAEYVVRPFA